MFPFADHRECETLTRLTVENVPRDGSLGRTQKFGKSADIWQTDDKADSFYFLERGQIDIFSGDPQAREILLQVVSAGEPFGELCFCAKNSGLRGTVARAHTDVEVLAIRFSDFLKYVRASEPVLTSLVCTLCLRLGDCETRTEILAYRGAQERLGRLLIQLAAKAIEVTKTAARRQGAVALHVTHLDLARIAAMSRSHVTVTLGHFRDLRLVQYARGRPLSVNLNALTTYVETRDRERLNSEG